MADQFRRGLSLKEQAKVLTVVCHADTSFCPYERYFSKGVCPKDGSHSCKTITVEDWLPFIKDRLLILEEDNETD